MHTWLLHPTALHASLGPLMAEIPNEEATATAEEAQAAFVAERFTDAEVMFKEAADLLRGHVLKAKQPDADATQTWVASQCGAASSARAQGGYARAEKWLNETEKFILKHFGEKDPIYANVLNERGILFKYQGKFKDAEAQYAKAKPLIVKGFGKSSESMAVLLHNLGGISHAQAKFKKAEAYAREGLAIREGLASPNPIAIAADQSALAAILDVAGQHDEAATLLTTALATFKKKLGARSFEVGVTMESLGNLHYRIEDLAKADKFLTAALEIQEERLGEGHPELGFALHNLAVVRTDRGHADQARPLLEKALETFKKSFGPKHSNTMVVKGRLEALSEAPVAPTKAAKAPAQKAAKKAAPKKAAKKPAKKAPKKAAKKTVKKKR